MSVIDLCALSAVAATCGAYAYSGALSFLDEEPYALPCSVPLFYFSQSSLALWVHSGLQLLSVVPA
jgi:hypothetical protein